MKVLVLGITGMLGSTVFKYLSKDTQLQVYGTLRGGVTHFFSNVEEDKLITHVNVLDNNTLISVFEKIRPDVVINCVGLIKQLSDAKDPLVALPINSMLPHFLAKLCRLIDARLIHISTDCVFSGKKGMYTEADISDAEDLYGKSKYIGELSNLPKAITLRTSIIGHELNSNFALLNWFLSQSGVVKGYSKAIFSGLPTVELARVIAKYVIPSSSLTGLYHVSVDPIDKMRLLRLVAEIYGKKIEIIEDQTLRIDRSLDSTRFKQITGYIPPSWPDLIQQMKEFNTLTTDVKENV